MESTLESLEAEAVALFERRGLQLRRRQARGGMVFDLVGAGMDAAGQKQEIALALRSWSAETPGEWARFAETEHQYLARAVPGMDIWVLAPGTQELPAPAIGIEALEKYVQSWSPLPSTRGIDAKDASKSLAFCAMPFREDHLDVYFLGIVPAVREAGYDVLRVDQSHDFRGITERIWDGITNSSFVIADLSGHNPNVMYEVGLAHAFACRTFLLIDDSTPVPFDVQDQMVVTYKRLQLHRLAQELPVRLKSALGKP